MQNEPLATYRVQMSREFTFEHCAAIAEYLADLGISHIYFSPILQATPGSLSGYDTTDFNKISEDLGGEEGWKKLTAAREQSGLGAVLDIVPNHMAANEHNAWWWDVLENGRASRYQAFFDVQWESGHSAVHNQVWLPILGSHYGRALENGELKIVFQDGKFVLRYFDQSLPLSPESLRELLSLVIPQSANDDMLFIKDMLDLLPRPNDNDPKMIERRERIKAQVEQRLRRLCRTSPETGQAVQQAVDEDNGNADRLHEILEGQNYQLAYWRSADSDLNYRRFFNINQLVGLHSSDDKVFEAIHALPLQWIRDGTLAGLRVDHIDGQCDPAGYLKRLRQKAPDAWIVVEKITMTEEKLPAFPVEGTTGYDFLNCVNDLFVEPSGEKTLTDFYREFTGEQDDFAQAARAGKRLLLQSFGGDLQRLTNILADICRESRRYRDYVQREMRAVLGEILVSFPVYRSYVRPQTGNYSPDDESCIHDAISRAREDQPNLDASLFQFVEDLLLLRVKGEKESSFVQRFQQLTGPLMAKGVEDTALYRARLS